MSGSLVLIGTPIGNLGDLSRRTVEAFERCDLLLCEDTRHTGQLLAHLNIRKPTESFHDHNEREKLDRVVAMIVEGRTVGLVSDAGMPLLSDPGFPLVREMRARGLTIEVVPGPFAAAVALVLSGLPPVPSAFFGFAPSKKNDRLDFYRTIAHHRMTAIVYESPHRIIESLQDAVSVLGDIEMALTRELTKMHEEVLHGPISAVLETMRSRENIRGEMTLVFGPAAETARGTAVDLRAEFNALRESGMRRPDAMKALAERHGLNRRELYKQLVDSGEEE